MFYFLASVAFYLMKYCHLGVPSSAIEFPPVPLSAAECRNRTVGFVKDHIFAVLSEPGLEGLVD